MLRAIGPQRPRRIDDRGADDDRQPASRRDRPGDGAGDVGRVRRGDDDDRRLPHLAAGVTGAQRERRSRRRVSCRRSASPPARSPRPRSAPRARDGGRGTPPRRFRRRRGGRPRRTPSWPGRRRWPARRRQPSSGSASTASSPVASRSTRTSQSVVVDADLGEGDARRADGPAPARARSSTGTVPGSVQQRPAPRHGAVSTAGPGEGDLHGTRRVHSARRRSAAHRRPTRRRRRAARCRHGAAARRRRDGAAGVPSRPMSGIRERDARRWLGRPQPGAPTSRQQGDDAGGDQGCLTEADRRQRRAAVRAGTGVGRRRRGRSAAESSTSWVAATSLVGGRRRWWRQVVDGDGVDVARQHRWPASAGFGGCAAAMSCGSTIHHVAGVDHPAIPVAQARAVDVDQLVGQGEHGNRGRVVAERPLGDLPVGVAGDDRVRPWRHLRRRHSSAESNLRRRSRRHRRDGASPDGRSRAAGR